MKAVLSYLWRHTILKWYRGHKEKQKEKYWAEHRTKPGHENPDKTFYVIRRRDWYCGLFSLFLTNLQRVDDALKAGYIPVVDLQNDFNIYLPEEKLGKENAWEYYFKQPCGYSLQDIKKSRNVIIGSGAVPDMFPYLDVDFLYGRTGELEYWRELVNQYMKLSDEAAAQVQREYDRLFEKSDKVLGVLCRGTDYVQGKPKNHPIQPTPIQAVEKAKEIFQERNCTKVFLATEDGKIYEVFAECFGDKLITNKSGYIEYKGDSIGKETYEKEGGSLESGMEYLTTVMLLAKCDCLCAGCVSATVAALLLTEGYEYTYLFDLGIYQ
jgi:hypothetical protein